MEDRESIALSGSSYYLYRGISGSDHVSASVTLGGLDLHTPSGLKSVSNPEVSVQPNVGDGTVGSAFPVGNSSSSFPIGPNTVVPTGESGKRKRGRPRKYGPEGATHMSLGLSPLSSTPPSSGSIGLKRGRGRPPGSGWKQQLAPLGEWMNSSAGLAFTPHVLHMTAGEDVAAKILAFSKQRQRAVCILSANGVVSAVTLRQPASCRSTVTYEGRFQILCLSGSYLNAENGGSHDITGGLSVSLCSPDGHVIGGGVDTLVAGSMVQVMFCSFLYSGSKPKNKTEVALNSQEEQNSELMPHKKSVTPPGAASTLNLTPSSSASDWPGPRPDLRNLQREIDLMYG
ncbi:hypothetical protein NMG60_11030444 [Bertholletia excelsa]